MNDFAPIDLPTRTSFSTSDERASTPATRQAAPPMWRSLDQLADTPEFRRFVDAEFPTVADSLLTVDRRHFLQLMGASLALAGLTSCTRQPEELLMPQVRAPENMIPGEPLYYATAMPLGSDAVGLLVESHMGRPTKVEGNPQHPSSLGATDVFAQASVLELYDPDRSRVLRNGGEIRPWSGFVTSVHDVMEHQRTKRGSGLRILTGTVISPTLGAQISALLDALPEAHWHQWDPVNRDNARAGGNIAFDSSTNLQFNLDRANVIVALDSDLLASGPQHLRHARQFAAGRRPDAKQANRLYVAEPTPTLTGAMADHRLPVASASIESIVRAIAANLRLSVAQPVDLSPAEAEWAAIVAADLQANSGAALLVVGDQQPPVVHVLAHVINDALANLGATIVLLPANEMNAVLHLDSLRDLTTAMSAGEVDALFILGSNPVFTAPTDLDFVAALQKVAYRVHLGLFEDETAQQCHWHIPAAHYLESWSDVRAYDGTVSIVQPLILPLYDGKNAHELLAALTNDNTKSSYDLVRGHWRGEHRDLDDASFERQWRRWLHDGVVAGSATPLRVGLRSDWRQRAASAKSDTKAERFEIVFRHDPHIYDGRFANNAWLQELPKPESRLVWDNAALIAPEAATQFGLVNGDIVELEHQGHKLEAPIWLQPGQARNTITLHFGYGRRRGGQLALDRGFDAYRLRASDGLWRTPCENPRKTGKQYRLVSTQDHGSMEGRELVRVRTRDDQRPEMTKEEERPESLYSDYEYKGYAWGMAIDLSTCIGCNACTIACQAENNIPVVGKSECSNGREMHWIRVDRYYEGEASAPEIHHQPVPCMHCENAPCEPVCPANATMHSNEGLNEMVYNRCVGTRYCANNCPYKVRRFNFRLYNDWNTESLKLQRNPDVTVRSRGVMEKCSYCVQRINLTRIQAKKEGRSIRDGEIVTACQQVCPTQAIVFGDINDPNSQVSQLKREQRNYGILNDLNTRPRTTYLAKLRNQNPSLKKA